MDGGRAAGYPSAMRRNTIGLIWVAGLLLAAAIYATGPDRFVQASLQALDQIQASLQLALLNLTLQAFDLMRSLAIALFLVFVCLAVLAARRGSRARVALVVVTLVFVALVYRASGNGPSASGRDWLAAFMLAAVGAAVMTHRLMRGPPLPPGPPGELRLIPTRLAARAPWR